jgi:hypothetical protein
MLIRFQGTMDFLNLLRISSEGTWFGMNPEAMPNLLGFILRIVQFPNPGIASLVGWLIYLAGVIVLCVIWQRANTADGRLLGLSVLITIVIAPHLHLHDLTLLIFPLLFVVNERVAASLNQRWMLLPLGTSLFLIAGILLDALSVTLLLFIILAWLLLYQGRSPAPQDLQAINQKN